MTRLEQLQAFRALHPSDIELMALNILIDQEIGHPTGRTIERLTRAIAGRLLDGRLSNWDFGKPSEDDVRLNAEDIAKKLGLTVTFDEYGNAVFHTPVKEHV